jgi:outer membrane lipoprotein SlyB
MKKTSKLILLGAFALTSSLFVSCTPGEKGAVVGGVTGAAIGAAVGDGTGAVIGGAVGAVAGSEISKKRARQNRGYYY